MKAHSGLYVSKDFKIPINFSLFYLSLRIASKGPTKTGQIGCHTSSTLVINTGGPQGCVLSSLLFTLYTMTALPDIEGTQLCSMMKAQPHTPVYISGAEVEQINIDSFLRFNLSWSLNINTLNKKAQKRFYFLPKC